jgi:hypothetical protein
MTSTRGGQPLTTVVFGTYLMASLAMAHRAIRSSDVTAHRRWMIRAFAVGIGVGMIRIVMGIAGLFGISIEESFGATFWIAFVMLAVLVEVSLRCARLLPVRARRAFATPR